MVSILKKRFREISDRKRLNIKAQWLIPLTKEELDKLGYNDKEGQQLAI